MNQLTLETLNDQKAYRPGDEISGAAFWKRDQAPRAVEVRLFWRTRGKGTEDLQVVARFEFPDPKAEEARPFRFQAPAAPYSFAGQLITLVWGVELVAEPGGEAARLEITIAPEGRGIVLGRE